MTIKTIRDTAMLVTLTISQWTARKYDKSVSKEVEQQHNAKDAGRYNKLLVAKEALEAINKTANAARTAHYSMTLPWGDKGDRLLPAMLFQTYTDKVRDFKGQFDMQVSRFTRDYPQLKADAQQRLGTMYNPLDYPPVDDIANRFGMEFEFTGIPTSQDFRVDLSADHIDNIRQDIEARVMKRQQEAMKDCWTRVREVVEHIHERLSDKDKTFRDSLIGNARELIAILPALNITGDAELAQLGTEVESLLLPPERLRADEALRSDTADKAAAILAKFGMKL